MSVHIHTKNHSAGTHDGSALLIVLWAIAMMSMTILGVVEYVQYDVEETAAMEKNFRARQLAGSGLAIGLHPLIKRGDSVLIQTIGPGESFEVHLRSEGSRLNINTVVQSREWDILGNLFVAWGMRQSDAVNMANAFETWTRPEKWQELASKANGTKEVVMRTPQVRGAPVPGAPGQPQLPSHRFQSLDEMLLIPGMDSVASAKADWRNYFTIWSDGPLDVNEASADLIKAVCGVGEVQAQRLVNLRLGPDGKQDTDDDVVFKDMNQIRQYLGMSDTEFAKIQGRLTLQDSVSRVESTGILGKYQRKIMVVARRTTVPPTYLLWQEQ